MSQSRHQRQRNGVRYVGADELGRCKPVGIEINEHDDTKRACANRGQRDEKAEQRTGGYGEPRLGALEAEGCREPIDVRCGQVVYSCCELPAATGSKAPAEFVGPDGAVRRDAHADREPALRIGGLGGPRFGRPLWHFRWLQTTCETALEMMPFVRAASSVHSSDCQGTRTLALLGWRVAPRIFDHQLEPESLRSVSTPDSAFDAV